MDEERSTPLRTPPEVVMELRRQRDSSSHAIRVSRVLARELLTHTCIGYDPADEEGLVEVFADTVEEYMKRHAAEVTKLLQAQVDEASTETGKLRARLSKLRRAVLVDYLSDGDMEKLVQAALEGIDSPTGYDDL